MSPFLVELSQGISSLVFVVVVIILMIHFAKTYLKYKEKNILYVSISLFFLSVIWMSDAVNLILILTLSTHLSIEIYYFFVLGFLPISIGGWFLVITNLMAKRQKKMILVIIAIVYAIFETIFLILLFLNAEEYIGVYNESYFDVQSSLFSQIYLFTSLSLYIITGFLMARQCLRVDQPEVRLKGKLLLMAMVLFLIGAGVEIITPIVAFTVFLSRLITICSSIFLYIAFTLPKFIKKRYLK
jgi:hypothetical protein